MNRNLLLTLFTLCFAFVAQAQSYTYHFANGQFNSQPSGGPTLQPIDTIISGLTVTVPVTTCANKPVINPAYFGHNSGFAAKAFFTDTYSIEMIFKFNELNGYNRIIDFSNSQSDDGIYTLATCLNFYPSGSIGTCPGAFDTTNYKQLVITRNGTTQQMNVYINDSLFTTYKDVNNYYIIGSSPNDSIKFFKDDLRVPHETGNGYVALLRMANYELLKSSVDSSYNSFCERIVEGVSQPEVKSIFTAYPNPASQNITINLTAGHITNCKLALTNSIGEVVWWKQEPVNNNLQLTLDLSRFTDGLYILRATSGNEVMNYKFIKTSCSGN